MTLHADEFRHLLVNLLRAGQEAGLGAIEINSGELHRRVGGYPGVDHRMPICCNVMRQEMKPGDAVLVEPPKGKGASLTIRYCFPRSISET